MITHTEVGRYEVANLLLPHVSVSALMSDSTSKPAPVSRVTGDANHPTHAGIATVIG